MLIKSTYLGVRKILNLDSSKLLTAFFICAFLMVSLSFIAGPDPRLKVYVFTSRSTSEKAISDFVATRSGTTITSLQEFGDLRTLTNIGAFSVAVIGDFYPPSLDTAQLKIYPALDDIPEILILNITEWQAYEEFSTEIQKRYSSKTSVIDDINSFDVALKKVDKRTNALGLDVSTDTYLAVSALVGLLSFILVFLGLAYVANKLVEIGRKPGIKGFAEAIALTILYFAFTQVTYIVCSVLLGMPLGLHTARLDAEVTAVSLIGFGGGGRPRMVAGIAGFLFGAFLSMSKGAKLDKSGLASLLLVGIFVVIDPLTSGVLFHEFVLLYSIGPYFETAVGTQSYVKTFLAEIGMALGGWASPTLGLSTGIILYCAGVVPFCLFSKLEKSTSTFLLFSCAFFAASGGIRVADMNPWSTIASIIPGIVAGLIFAVLFSLVSFSEKMMRRKLGM